MPKRFLALGDSYTIGTSVDSLESWPFQLVNRLNAAGIPVNPPDTIAQNGWATSDLIAGIAAADIQGPYDLVTLLIGVNNQYRNGDIETYRAEFGDLLEVAIRFAGGDPSKVIVLSIPDWSVTPFAMSRDRPQIATQIDQFNTVNREIASSAGVRYVDVTSLSRSFGGDAEFVAVDGLHPSGKMYAAWVDLLLPIVSNMLQSKLP